MQKYRRYVKNLSAGKKVFLPLKIKNQWDKVIKPEKRYNFVTETNHINTTMNREQFEGQISYEPAEMVQMDEQMRLALEILKNTHTHLFLTGKAGTGKTTFLKNLKHYCQKRMIVLAPTGVAAMNAGGVTIHSFFQLPFGPYIPGDFSRKSEQKFLRFGKEKMQIVRSLDLLVIDEVSMVRADLLDAVSDALKRYRQDWRPFGGVQLLMIGDLQQLAPVVKEDEWELLCRRYASPFFFDSHELKRSMYWQVELREVYRQSDASFVEILNQVRENRLDADAFQKLNERYMPGFRPSEAEHFILLTTHNYKAQQINNDRLNQCPGSSFLFQAEVKGDFLSYNYPTEENLMLKAGAQVMFVKNDSSGEGRYYNGKLGRITSISSSRIIVTDKEGKEIQVGREMWKNMKYALNPSTKAIEEKQVGTFVQYPLKLAWAITIHKSQGLTFERAIIDVSEAFTHGQIYVALSRCRTWEGLVLNAPISPQLFVDDERIVQFTKEMPAHLPTPAQLKAEQQRYYFHLLLELFDFKELYQAIFQLTSACCRHIGTLYTEFCKQNEVYRNTFGKKVECIGLNFQKQLKELFAQSIDYLQDDYLQERIRKGCAYFLPKLDELCLPLLKVKELEIDNKQNRKQLHTLLASLEERLGMKRATLETSREGFSIEAYLSAKAKAIATDWMGKEKKKSLEITKADILHPDLFNRLKSWRWELAKEKDVPAYVILHTRVLLGIANLLPQNEEDLRSVPGMGDKRVERYGAELLKIVKDYQENLSNRSLKQSL